MTKSKYPHVMIYMDGDTAEWTAVAIGHDVVAAFKRDELEERAYRDEGDGPYKVYVYAGELGKDLHFVEEF